MVSTQLKPRVDGEALKVAKVVLKRRDRNLMVNAQRAKTIQKMRKMRKSQPTLIKAVNGDELLKKRRCGEKDKHNIIISKKKQFMERRVPADATCLLVARNSRTPDLPKVKVALSKLGLFAYNSCRVIATTPENIDLIRICDAYLYYGVATRETMSTLVHKKAFLAAPKSLNRATKKGGDPIVPVPLNNNAIVEDTLSEHGLICVEDLVEVLLAGRSDAVRFEKVSSFLASFTINPDQKKMGSKFNNERPTRGFLPKIETIISRLV